MTHPATTAFPITPFPITRFTIPHDHPCLPGHFPGRPIVPGVVVLDRVLAAIEAGHGGALGALRMPQVKFAQPLLPGEEARIEVEALPDIAPPRWRFRVLRGDALLASGDALLASGEVRAADDRDPDPPIEKTAT